MERINNYPQPIDRLWLEELNTILGKYKAGKVRPDTRVKFAENWWKMRNLFEEQKTTASKNNGFRAITARLYKTIVQKQPLYHDNSVLKIDIIIQKEENY